MGTPSWVEMALAVSSPTGRRIAESEGRQRNLPQINPATTVGTVVAEIAVPVNKYAVVLYRLDFICPPRVFHVQVMHQGTALWEGDIDARILDQGLQLYIPIPDNSPVRLNILNEDTIAHPMYIDSHYASFVDDKDYEEFNERIRQYFGGSLMGEGRGG